MAPCWRVGPRAPPPVLAQGLLRSWCWSSTEGLERVCVIVTSAAGWAAHIRGGPNRNSLSLSSGGWGPKVRGQHRWFWGSPPALCSRSRCPQVAGRPRSGEKALLSSCPCQDTDLITGAPPSLMAISKPSSLPRPHFQMRSRGVGLQ